MAKGKRLDPLGRKLLGPLLKGNPALLKVLDRHGVTFCGGCYLTLFASLEKAAAYHAVGDKGKFLADVKKALRAG